MAAITREQVLDQLKTVNDPELHKDLVTLGMVKNIEFEGATVRVHIELTTPACPQKGQMKDDIERAVRQMPGVEAVEVEWSARVRPSGPESPQLPEVKNVLAVGAGKGGVGKSMVSVLLAYGLQRSGAQVGLMDADVYGPSIPTMTGVAGARPTMANDKIIPTVAAGVKVISIGLMLDPDRPVIWRGPMVHNVVNQFLGQVDWGTLDYLIVDLPPGTGDAPLSLSQAIPMTGAVVVSTPQDIALQDARRAVKMYEQLGVNCLGIIENMSYYLCPQCGHREELFDHGGARAAAAELGVPFLGEIPLNVKVRVHGDAGAPEKIFEDTDDHVRAALDLVVGNTAGQISVRSQQRRVEPAPKAS